MSPLIFETIVGHVTDMGLSELRSSMESAGYDPHINADRRQLLETILDQPSAYLHRELHILERPALLAGMFIEFDDEELDAGLTYLVDEEAAQEIASGDATIVLRSGGTTVLVPRARIERAFSNGCTLDYQETR